MLHCFLFQAFSINLKKKNVGEKFLCLNFFLRGLPRKRRILDLTRSFFWKELSIQKMNPFFLSLKTQLSSFIFFSLKTRLFPRISGAFSSKAFKYF